MAQALRALPPLGCRSETTHFPWSADHYFATGETLPQGACGAARQLRCDLVRGARRPARAGADRRPRCAARAALRAGPYINLRPVQLIDERLCPIKGKRTGDINFTVLRENTEGPYVQMGGSFKRDTADEVAISEDLHTRRGVERIIRAAYTLATTPHGGTHSPPRVCMVDKANALPHAHGLWQRTFKAVAREFPAVAASHLYVDVAAMEFVRAPERFDIVVTSNLFPATSSPILGRRCAAGSGGRFPATFIPDAARSSSQCTARPRIWRTGGEPAGGVFDPGTFAPEHIGEPLAAQRGCGPPSKWWSALAVRHAIWVGISVRRSAATQCSMRCKRFRRLRRAVAQPAVSESQGGIPP